MQRAHQQLESMGRLSQALAELKAFQQAGQSVQEWSAAPVDGWWSMPYVNGWTGGTALADLSLPLPHPHTYTDDGVRPMSLALWGGPAPKGDAAWGGGGSGDGEQGAAIWLQACNAPLVSLLQTAAFGASGAMQYKAIQVLYWAGYVCLGGTDLTGD